MSHRDIGMQWEDPVIDDHGYVWEHQVVVEPSMNSYLATPTPQKTPQRNNDITISDMMTVKTRFLTLHMNQTLLKKAVLNVIVLGWRITKALSMKGERFSCVRVCNNQR